MENYLPLWSQLTRIDRSMKITVQVNEPKYNGKLFLWDKNTIQNSKQMR